MLINPNIKQIAYDPKLKKCEVLLECGDELVKKNLRNIIDLFRYLHLLVRADRLVITKNTRWVLYARNKVFHLH